MVWISEDSIMDIIRVTEWVDIQAPREEVFDLVVDLKRRMQLSPLWGMVSIENPFADYPLEGSSYDVEIPEKEGSCFETVIIAFKPQQKLTYQSNLQIRRCKLASSGCQHGTRLIYTEEFLDEESEVQNSRRSFSSGQMAITCSAIPSCEMPGQNA